MLTAKTTEGKLICLGLEYDKNSLLLLKGKEEFFCPVCGEKVVLKLGDQRIYHFAHLKEATCRSFYERETLYHMEGKRQLYQWLITQGIYAELEWYDAEIQQRPDVMFSYNGNTYALEFQCSPIPEDIFIKRTNAYKGKGYIPLWIIGNKYIKAKRTNLFEFSHFEYFFLTKSNEGQYYIPSYCPEKKIFQIFSHIVPFSIKNAFSNCIQSNCQSFLIDDLLEPKVRNQLSLKQWTNEIEKFNMNSSLRPTAAQHRFLREIYTRYLNPFLLPPEIGIPVRHSIFIQTPLINWQTYIFMDVLQNVTPNNFINLKYAESCFLKRINRKEIIIRKLPQISKSDSTIVVKEYFQQLAKLNIMDEHQDFYLVKKRVTVPNSNREKEKYSTEFYQKYHQILSKI